MGVEFGPGSLAGALGLLGVGIAMIIPDNKWVGALFVFAAVLVLFFDIRVTGWRFSSGFAWTRHRPLAVVGMVVFGLGLLGCAGWYFWPWTQQNVGKPLKTQSTRPQAVSEPGVILVQCNIQVSDTIPPDRRENVLPLHPINMNSYTGPGPFLEMFAGPQIPVGSQWNKTGDPNGFEYRCEITNYDTATLFNVEMGFRIIFNKAVKVQGGGIQSGEVALDKVFQAVIPRIDVGPNNPFIFHFWNASDDNFVRFMLPGGVVAQRLGENVKRRLRLIDTPVKLFFLAPHKSTDTAHSGNSH